MIQSSERAAETIRRRVGSWTARSAAGVARAAASFRKPAALAGFRKKCPAALAAKARWACVAVRPVGQHHAASAAPRLRAGDDFVV